MYDKIQKYPELLSDWNYHEMTRGEIIEEWWRRFKIMFDNEDTAKIILRNSEKTDYSFSWSYPFPGASPMHLHMSMFTKSISFLGSEE